MIQTPERHDTGDSTTAVVAHVRALIDRGALGPGARLPPERDLALQVGVSRPTVRAGLRTLAALGVIRSRRGSGTYIPDGPPTLGSEALSFLAALHKFTVDDVHEARRVLEVGAAGLAAKRATPDHLATLADEVACLFASLSERQVFLVHDINFHRSLAVASGTRSSHRSSRWCRRSTMSAGATRLNARSIGICATPPRRTARSIRRSARTTSTGRGG